MTQPEKQKEFKKLIEELRRAWQFGYAMSEFSVSKETCTTILQLTEAAHETAVALHHKAWATSPPASAGTSETSGASR